MDLTPKQRQEEKQTAGWGNVSNAHMDNQKRQNTEN